MDDENKNKYKELYSSIYDEIHKILQEQCNTLYKKGLDYGVNSISMSLDLNDKKNIDIVFKGLIYRINDKVQRLINIVLKNNNKIHTKDENIIDTIKDLLNYCIIAQIVLKGKWKE